MGNMRPGSKKAKPFLERLSLLQKTWGKPDQDCRINRVNLVRFTQLIFWHKAVAMCGYFGGV